MAHIDDLAAHHGMARPRSRLPTRRGPSQFFPGAALYQQWNEITQGALVKLRIHVLDYSRNVIVRKFRVLLGQTALYRIDLCPLFLRHAQYHKQRTGFSPRITGFSPGYELHDDPVQRAWCRRGRRGWAGRPPGRRADLEQCRWDLRQVVAARKTVLEAGWRHLCEFVALVVA
jgi:hypothetical protein